MPSPLSFLARRASRRAVPWLAYYEAARAIATRGYGAWSALTPAERDDLQRILRSSHGRPGAVSQPDRRRLQALVRKAMGGALHPGRH